jgi:pimeloyl-ACP methyl ester carboxylesterase
MKKITKKIVITTSIIGFITVIIALINKLTYLFSSLDNNLYNPNSYYYEWKFGKIHYTVSGSGKPLLLVHSLKNGASLYEFNKLIKTLSKSRTVYAIDLIGYGKSEKPKLTYTAYLYVQLLSDFIQHVVDGRPDIITSGKTNAIVTMLTLQYPTEIDKLIFINPEDLNQLSRNPNTKDSVVKYIIEIPILGTFIYNTISSRNNITHLFNKKYIHYNSSYLNKFITAFYEAAHLGQSSNKFPYASNNCKYTNVNIYSGLKDINHSIYLIQGSERTIDPAYITSNYKDINASIESSIINKTKDFPHIENPSATIELLSIFLH